MKVGTFTCVWHCVQRLCDMLISIREHFMWAMSWTARACRVNHVMKLSPHSNMVCELHVVAVFIRIYLIQLASAQLHQLLQAVMHLCKSVQTLCVVHELTSSYSIADIPQGMWSGVANCNPSFKMAIANGSCCRTFLSNTIVLLLQDWSRNPLNTYTWWPSH